MIIITERSKILSIIDKWKEAYCSKFDDKILNDLKKLNLNTTTAEEVNAIIGNDAWTSCECDECKQKVQKIIMVGEEPDYESRTAFLCKDCLSKAFSMMNEGE
jgi:hypothetical protein